MLWAAQTPLNSREIGLVLNHLKASKLSPTKDAEGQDTLEIPLDHASVHLVMSLLYSLEPFGVPGIDVDQFADADEQGKVSIRFTLIIIRLIYSTSIV